MVRVISCLQCVRWRPSTARTRSLSQKRIKASKTTAMSRCGAGGMFVLAGAPERLRAAERERFVTQQWPPIRNLVELLGLDADELLTSV
jgi:hypothetical protein